MINLKKIIGQGFEARDKGLELIGSTIQKAAESVGLGIDDSGLVRKLPVDIANDPALNKEFLTVFEKNYPTIKGAKIVINGSKDWIREYQFNRLIERNRIAAAIFEEDGAHYSQWFTFTQNWADDGWGDTLIKIAHSKSKIDPTIL
ncbi:hypothetical protein EAX61_12250 [Dokdonia sinensis]|uniref:Uncharacterized protein n=1 Tax=Dokdonia sinensis TaxID=2479847 RepID=A0A3M0FXA2_9FLAO|nr:hypothetical protein [Dokdonia sinensis]RMB57135.1 hypothetical protein EAX61_12250 [Dokdonia sinensis]